VSAVSLYSPKELAAVAARMAPWTREQLRGCGSFLGFDKVPGIVVTDGHGIYWQRRADDVSIEAYAPLCVAGSSWPSKGTGLESLRAPRPTEILPYGLARLRWLLGTVVATPTSGATPKNCPDCNGDQLVEYEFTARSGAVYRREWDCPTCDGDTDFPQQRVEIERVPCELVIDGFRMARIDAQLLSRWLDALPPGALSAPCRMGLISTDENPTILFSDVEDRWCVLLKGLRAPGSESERRAYHAIDWNLSEVPS
jgi:hypothetical protein